MEHRLQTRPTPQARQQEATAARGGLILAVLLGSVYLSRAGGHPAGPAMSGTAAWLAALSLAGMPAALTMMRGHQASRQCSGRRQYDQT